MDLFDIIFNVFSPYMFSILKLALAITFFSQAIKIIRSRTGTGSSGTHGNPYTGLTTAFMGYLFGRGIPILIGLIDVICDDILSRL